MKKMIVSALAAVIILFSAGIFYLNEVILPTKARFLVVKEIERYTQKKVLLQALRFNIFKGLVLESLVIYDDTSVLLNSKEVSCSLLVLPFFKKQLIIPSIKLDSPVILLERRADNSFNIADLFTGYISNPKSEFNVIIHKIVLKNGRVKFEDETLTPSFKKEINKIDAHLYLSLPDKLRFDASFEIPGASTISVDSSGEYAIGDKEITAKFAVRDFSCNEFTRYYEGLNVSIPKGTVDYFLNLTFKDSVLDGNLTGASKGLVIVKDKLSATLDSDIKYGFRNDFKGKKFNYSGSLAMRNLKLSGIEGIGGIDDIKGTLEFDNSRVWSENLSATIAGVPVKAKANLAELAISLLDIYITSDMKLETLQGVLKDKFSISIPFNIEGVGKLNIALQYKFPIIESPEVKGSLELSNAVIRGGKEAAPARDINGEVRFTKNQLTWENLNLKYLDAGYKTSGMLTNFRTPGVQMELSSKDLALKAVFALDDKLFKFSRLSGHYLNSEFSMAGDLDVSNPARIHTDMNGTLEMDMEDVKGQLKKFKEKLDRMKPLGRVHTEFSLKGDPRNLKFCAIDAKFSSTTLSIYGFKPLDFLMDYSQTNGTGEIKRVHSFLYGGTLDASGRIELASENLPYSIDADIQGVKLEKLKYDTALKDKDISGVIHAKLKLDSSSDDIEKLKGSGRLSIGNGRLWQINLFKGIGVLLFTSDFSEVVFKDSYCDFVIADGAISTDDLTLKSDLLELYGSMKITFKNSINASLKSEFTNEAIESGAAKKFATAIGKYSMIEINGTLKEPKYTMRPDVGGIIEDIKGIFS